MDKCIKLPDTMHKLNGSCHCGNIRLELYLPNSPETYNPRMCDCDFCRKHGASYITDHMGLVIIRLRNNYAVNKYRQGAEIAEFLICSNCGVLVAIHYQSEGRSFAAANSKVIDSVVFGESIQVSPKALSASEKAERWKRLWFQNVEIVSA